MIPAPITQEEFDPQPVRRAETFLNEMGGNYQDDLFPFMTDEDIDNFLPAMNDRLFYLPFGPFTPLYEEFVGSSYRYDEQAISGYAQADWRPSSRLSVNVGLRMEVTDVEVKADTVINFPAEERREIETRTAQRTYPALLPMLSLKYALTNQSNLRFGLTRSFRRPNFDELKPAGPIVHYADFHFHYGNPNLRPTYSWNADLAYQRLWGYDGMLTLSVFGKYVTDHIFSTSEALDVSTNSVPSTFNLGGVAAKAYENAPFAYVLGGEFNITRKLNMLPGFWKDFEAAFNYAFIHSRMRISARETLQPLPRQARHVLNARLTYETRKLNLNLGFNYRSDFLDELNLFAVNDPVTGELQYFQDSTDFDIFMGPGYSLDWGASWAFSEHLALSFELSNLLNNPFIRYRGRRDRPVQTEYYGIRGLVGLKWEL